MKQIDNQKTCTNCGETKPLDAFQYIKTQQRFVAQCKDCVNAKRIARARLKGVKPKKQMTDLVRGVKICSYCKQEKPLSEFYYDKSTNSYNYLCKECARKKDTEKRRAKGIKSKEEQRLEWEQKGEKPCIKCGQTKPLEAFPVDKRTGYFRNVCIECNRKYFQDYELKNAKHKKAYFKRYYEENRNELLEYQETYRNSHKELIAERDKKYRKKNADKIRENRAKYYEKNKEQFHQKHKEYYEKNADKIKEYQRQYREDNAEKVFIRRKLYREKNAEIIKQRKKEYAQTHREHINAYYYAKLQNDQLFKLKSQIRNLIGVSLRARGYGKESSTAKILGCDYETFFKHLQDTWLVNYGTKWNGEPYHIDHIVPLATAKTRQDVLDLCHYTNLQMLKPEDNLAKKDSLTWQIDNNER